jgi:hypothetical protein
MGEDLKKPHCRAYDEYRLKNHLNSKTVFVIGPEIASKHLIIC